MARLPFQPLLDHARRLYGPQLNLAQLAVLCGISDDVMRNAAWMGSVSWAATDRFAVGLGRHPCEVWADD